MIPELFFLPPADVALSPEYRPLPMWWTLGLAGAAALVASYAMALS
jgi:hypothetical protein